MVKGAIYGFLIGLALAIIFIADTITHVESGVSTSYTIPMREYVLKLLRFSVKASLATTVVLWIREIYLGPRKEGEPSFIIGIVKSFVIVFALIILVLMAISAVTNFIMR
ncbi:hypothetical protein [Paenibacillus mendelii]|uniref:Uncharacterized protein n=1 Tax=Paenibacillus mendelii TaxID=206163 RepID=A0ABV6J1T2_9BACL|nr:hypothetical protein [Paenibacillus mendelii]MCQ6562753.1 hypothetical protein [Paenibacillus mendelii]